MSWNTTMTTMVRVLINDLEATPVYSDERIEQLIVVAAFYVQQDISFGAAYSINIGTPDISPDPTETTTLDDDFTAFVVLKAACLADQSTLRLKNAIDGIKTKLGPAEMSVSNTTSSFMKILEEGPCKLYEQMKMEYMFSGKGLVRATHAILGPFVSNKFDPKYNLNTYEDRR